MRKLLGAGALVALILLVPVATSSAGAKAKPTTTTAPTTTTTTPAAPTLGVPHVVSSAPNGDFGILESLSCPTGEVALSFAWASIGSGPGGFFPSTIGNAFVPPHRPIITNGVPTGYEWHESTGVQAQAHVTCAPIIT